MNRNEVNGFKANSLVEPVVVEDPGRNIRQVEVEGETAKQPYVPEKAKQKPSLKDNARVLLIGGGIALVLLLLAISGVPPKPLAPPKRSGTTSQEQSAKPPDNGANARGSVVPLMDSGRRPDEGTDQNMIHPEEIARTANKQPKPSPGTNLGSVPPFEHPDLWQPTPYQPGAQPETPISNNVPAKTVEATETKSERDTLDKASLVFVRSNTGFAATPRLENSSNKIDLGIGLAPGTRLRARLESTASTAVQTPVLAVIEYNYEHNGEIVVPAGAKAVGRLEAADRSGYIAVRFDYLMLPDGSTINMEAAATDLELRPLKGKVEGKHSAKNILVRSFAGVGEIAATLARSSLNQPLSEGDLLREKMSNNIAQSSDQEVAKLAITEHLVISVPADTEIYVVLQKPAGQTIQGQTAKLRLPTQIINQPGIEELRQLLQLQRELNQAAPKQSAE
jgi:hypothetical protein